MSRVFAVVYTETIRIEGDERSRTHPGHGYPAHTVEHRVFKEFEDEAAFTKWVEKEAARLASQGKPLSFQAYCCTPINVGIQTKVQIDWGDL